MGDLIAMMDNEGYNDEDLQAAIAPLTNPCAGTICIDHNPYTSHHLPYCMSRRLLLPLNNLDLPCRCFEIQEMIHFMSNSEYTKDKH
ncbi:hypothetical protein LSTR_LSTR014248 [Laodelphax striatellus]|uniref:Uncharacterized protein n=1 Tax=Laodelphax striatellus TaxID=195883 RepID=A0A482WDK9_LAOST|nr:hypothetical protein LSTR_LSTR014248 [Laodelphax striatellus]